MDEPSGVPVRVSTSTSATIDRRVEHRQLSAQSVGLRKVGHFGFFRETASERGWPIALDWLATA